MANYKFTQFNLEIVNPTWEVKSVTDNYDNTCSVEIVLSTDTAKFGVSLSGFTYKETWEDADIFAFVPQALKEFEI